MEAWPPTSGAVGAAESDVYVGGDRLVCAASTPGTSLCATKSVEHAGMSTPTPLMRADAHLATAQALAADLCRGARIVDHVDVDA